MPERREPPGNGGLRWFVEEAVCGRFPPADGGVTVLPPPSPGGQVVLALTGHAVVATSHPRAEVLAQGADGFGGATAPSFLVWLAGAAAEIGSLDVLLAAAGRPGRPLPPRDDLDGHPRVQRARAWREEVRVLGDARGLVTLGQGVGGLLSMGVEVAEGARSRGWGRRLIGDALASVPVGQTVLAEVAPGNAQSLRAFLSCGFTPLGSIVHVLPATTQRAGGQGD